MSGKPERARGGLAVGKWDVIIQDGLVHWREVKEEDVKVLSVKNVSLPSSLNLGISSGD